MNKEGTKRPIRCAQENGAMVQAFQAGDEAGFDELVLKHKDRIFRLCYWFLSDYHEANDAAQETFISVFRSLKKFKFESTFSTWLHRVAVNTCKNRLKSAEYRYGKRMVSLDNPGAESGQHASLPLKGEPNSPMVELERKERWMLIKTAIDSLPTEQRMVVALRDIQGLSYDEIAQITGFNMGTVKSKLARARLELREKLKGVI